MGHHRPFHLRHFSVMHHLSTMKVGTDAILLGAWADCENAQTALDIGSGSGILALMLAQRNALLRIDAIDLDFDSVNEAALNFETSQWRNRLKAFQGNIIQYAQTALTSYDFIISNPPFFNQSVKPQDLKRNLARHTDALPYIELIRVAFQLLTPDGIFAVVLPCTEGKSFIEMAQNQGLYLKRLLHIIPVEGREPNRMNMEFSKINHGSVIARDFAIRDTHGHYTQAYHVLLHKYYLGLNSNSH